LTTALQFAQRLARQVAAMLPHQHKRLLAMNTKRA
jgi:hypothetical protein